MPSVSLNIDDDPSVKEKQEIREVAKKIRLYPRSPHYYTKKAAHKTGAPKKHEKVASVKNPCQQFL